MKVAVVGTGSAGMHHLRALRRLSGVEPIAVPLRPSRMVELEADGYQTVPDIHSAVFHGATAAIIATDTGRHMEDALAASEEGVDVLVEKPLSVDSVGAERMCNRAFELGRTIYVGCVLRFSESLNAFRESLQEVGQLHSARIECRSFLPDWRPSRPYQESYSVRPAEGGVLRDLIHEVDYAGWIFGWPHATEARLANTGRLGIDAEELADLAWETPAGCLVSVNLDYLSKPSRRRMAAYGEHGTIVWDGIEGIVTIMREEAPTKELRFSQSPDDMFTAQAQAFVCAIGGNWDPRLATGGDGVKALAVCDAARKASDNKREEKVVYP